MDNANDKESEEVGAWDVQFVVEDKSSAKPNEKTNSGNDRSPDGQEDGVDKDFDVNNETATVDSPDIAINRSPKPRKPRKEKKKKQGKKKENSENVNGEIENTENADAGDDSLEEDDAKLEREISLTEIDADGPARNSLFEKGMQLERKKKKDLALKCYLRCLNGLKDDTKFAYVPQCLHNIADIYYEKDESVDKAVQFIQAEKMYYETALIDTSELQKKLEERQKELEGEDDDDDPIASKPEALRATEYEHLAQLCLDKSQPQLALEYCGKATKLRQQVYGENHPISLKTLDFFTIVYAEAGKQQYSESMKKFTEEDLVNLTDLRLSGDLSNLRQRTKKTDDKGVAKGEDKKVHFEEDPHELKPDEEHLSRVLLWVFFMISAAVIAVLGFYLYCRLNTRSLFCRNFGTNVSYYYMRMKYYYYHYTTFNTATYG